MAQRNKPGTLPRPSQQAPRARPLDWHRSTRPPIPNRCRNRLRRTLRCARSRRPRRARSSCVSPSGTRPRWRSTRRPTTTASATTRASTSSAPFDCTRRPPTPTTTMPCSLSERSTRYDHRRCLLEHHNKLTQALSRSLSSVWRRSRHRLCACRRLLQSLGGVGERSGATFSRLHVRYRQRSADQQGDGDSVLYVRGAQL